MSRRLDRLSCNLVFTTSEDKNVTSTAALPRLFAVRIVATRARDLGDRHDMQAEPARSDTTLVIGAGPIPSAVAAMIKAFDGPVLAADGGAAAAMSLGLSGFDVVGDLDSIDAATRAALDPARVIHDRDQDTTDFQKCLARITTAQVIAAGVLGGRLDHSLAALTAIVTTQNRDIIALGEEDLVFPVRAGLCLDLAPGTRVSLYPMGGVAGRSTGLEWPIDGLVLSPDGRVATSNRATGPVTLDVDGPLLAILPLGALKTARDGLGRVRSR